jgi:redox-sensitive bicupin YhaK (pirin superfamily)
VTWLFEGEFEHRDSLGTVQRIAPGDVNWMSAGRGIVHSERTPQALRATSSRAHGMQTWVALPQAQEQARPSFSHHPGDTLPQLVLPGASIRVIAGAAWGERSPVPVASPTLYCAIDLAAGAGLELPDEHEQRALYPVEGNVSIGGMEVAAGEFAVLAPGRVALVAETRCRLMLLGGAPVGERFIWWNFVASTREKIESARADWSRYGEPAEAGARFGPVPGETEFIPLPAK